MRGQGRYPDPFGIHESRWLSRERPTSLVRDQGLETHDAPPGPPPAPTVDPHEYRQGPRRYWTVLLPGVFTFGSIVLIWGADGVAGFFPVSDVSQPDPRLSALNAFAGWPQLAVFVAVVALLIVAAFRPWWRRAIALIGWGISLLDVGCLFLITAVYPTY